METVRGRTAEVILDPENGRVIKKYIWFTDKVPPNLKGKKIPNTRNLEVGALRKLEGILYFPQLIEEMENSIIMTHCGEKLTYKNMPHDYKWQVEEIVRILRIANVVHRDIRPDNLMVRDGLIQLIDFGWATTFEDKENLRIVVGGKWKCSKGYEDRYSLIRSIGTIIKEG
jgi:tRNA A-37 threonylcarbamoyl transferase component Bud32